MNTSQKIIAARKELGLTQQQLADFAGVTVRTIQRIENGQTTPRGFTLNAIAKALGLPLSDLMISPTLPPISTAPASSDQNEKDVYFLRILCLSCFAYLVIPFVHFLIPRYILKKQVGLAPVTTSYARQLILRQVYWSIALQLLMLATLGYNFIVLIYFSPLYFIHYLVPVAIMHLVNAVILVRYLLRLQTPRIPTPVI